jgi:hypothetical protein
MILEEDVQIVRVEFELPSARRVGMERDYGWAVGVVYKPVASVNKIGMAA